MEKVDTSAFNIQIDEKGEYEIRIHEYILEYQHPNGKTYKMKKKNKTKYRFKSEKSVIRKHINKKLLNASFDTLNSVLELLNQ